MTGTLVAAAVLTAGSQVYGGMAAQQQGRYEQAINQQNAQMEKASATDAARRGSIEEQRRYRALAQQMGQQRAGLAASGFDLSFGSAANLVSDTAMIGNEDVATIRENTRREMTGYDINAANYTMAGRAARAKGNAAMVGGVLAAGGTILGAANQVAGASAPGGRNYKPKGGI